MPVFQIEGALIGAALVDALAASLSCSKRRAKALLDARIVYVNDRRVWIASHQLRKGDVIEVRDEQRSTTALEPESLFEDAHYLIINKPASILSEGKNSIEEALRLARGTLWAVHRLDRDTTGCLLLAKTEAARGAAEELFKNHLVTKRYLALAVGRSRRDHVEITTPIDGKAAFSSVTVRKRFRQMTLFEVIIATGRTHQIRRHLSSIGHPVVGDRHHGTGRALSASERAVPRQMLHAERLEFVHPITGCRVVAVAPLPDDLKSAIRGAGR